MGRLRFTIGSSRRHPRFDIELFGLAPAQITCAYVYNPIRQFKGSHYGLGIGKNLFVKFSTLVGIVLANDYLLDFIELVDSV